MLSPATKPTPTQPFFIIQRMEWRDLREHKGSKSLLIEGYACANMGASHRWTGWARERRKYLHWLSLCCLAVGRRPDGGSHEWLVWLAKEREHPRRLVFCYLNILRPAWGIRYWQYGQPAINES